MTTAQEIPNRFDFDTAQARINKMWNDGGFFHAEPDPSNPEHQEILDLFGAAKFIPTTNANYAQIEEIGRKIGKIK